MTHQTIYDAIDHFLDTVSDYFLQRGVLLELTFLQDEVHLNRTPGMIEENEQQYDSQGVLAKLEAEQRQMEAKIVMFGWKIVNPLARLQLDTCDLRKFLHFMDEEEQERASALWDSGRLDLEGITLRLRYVQGVAAGTTPAPKGLSDGAKRILQALSDGKPRKGNVIAKIAKLAYDTTRKLLSRLKRDGYITHKKGEGYRLASDVPGTC